MLLRILLCTPRSPRQKTLKDALCGRAQVTLAKDDQEFWAAIRGDVFDLTVVSTEALGGPGRRSTASLRVLMDVAETPDVVLIARADAADSSLYLAAGCLAVLDDEWDDADLIGALDALATRASAERDRRVMGRARIDRRLDAMGTRSEAIRRFQDTTRRVAANDSPVLIQGEPGTGKAWLGPVIHRESSRARGPFHSLRCGGRTKEALDRALFGVAAGGSSGAVTAERGALERAHRGTLFLERIDDAPISFQEKLLRYLDTGAGHRVGERTTVRVDVRLLASVKDQPDAHVEAGNLDPELYRRIGLVSLTPPPLRDRPDDVPELAHAAHQRCSARYGLAAGGFTTSAMDALQRHNWPGNVSELWSVVERSTLLSRGDRIGVEDLPPDIAVRSGTPSGDGVLVLDAPWLLDPAQLPTLRGLRAQALEVVERAYLVELLRSARGRVAEAARRAEVDPRSLFDRMRRYGLRKEDFKPSRRSPRRGPAGA